MINSDFSKNVLTLMTGTTLAQIVPLAISPILTRIYSPREFGILALYMAVFAIISGVATLRYELAIIQPKSNKDVDRLTVVSIVITFFVSFITFLGVVYLGEWFCIIVSNLELLPWLNLLPISIFLSGCFQSLNYWFSRKTQYIDIAVAKVYRGGAVGTINLAASNIKVDAFGLIIGFFVGQVVAIAILTKKAFRLGFDFNQITSKKCLALANHYRKFPLLSTPGALLNNAALHMPIMLLSRFFEASNVGFFNFSFRIIGAPFALISGALGQVLLQKIATVAPSEVHDFVVATFKRLVLIALLPIILVFAFGEDIFAFVFSEEWREAGKYSTILIFSIAIRFVASPLSMVLALDQNIKVGVAWQGISFVSVFTVLYLAKELPIMEFIFFFVLQDVLMYSLYLCLILRASKQMKYCG